MENKEKKVITSPLRAIRQFCIQCSGDSPREASACPEEKCPLWNFKTGHSPFTPKRELSEEQKRAGAERLAKYRKDKLAEKDT